MDEEALLARLQALEQVNADRARKEGMTAFMNAHGADFSNNEALGNVLYDALASRIGPEDTAEAKEAAYKQMVDTLMEDLDNLAKVFKMQLRALDDTVDEVKSNAEDIQKKISDSTSAKEQTTPEAEGQFMPPEGFDMSAEPDFSPSMLPPMEGTVPPEAGMPAPDMGEAVPPEVSMPTPDMTVSDNRLKNIRMKLAKGYRG